MTEAPRILGLWAVPRSRSTAFLRMMVSRGDYAVLHEPFSTRADFGKSTVDGVAVTGEAELIAAIRGLADRTPVFFKDTTDFHYPQVLADTEFLASARHTFIIRDPAEAIASHYALNNGLRRDDIGFGRVSELYDAVAAQTGTPPVVIDSADLVARPEATVRAYCAAVGLPFRAEALSWQPGLLNEWQQTSRWHESTGSTTGFTTVERSYTHTVANTPLLADYLDYHLPYYHRLHQRRLVVSSG